MIKNISETPYVYSYTVPDHKGHKENIIELIKKIPHNPYETVSHQDYNLHNTMKREYKNYFLKNIFLKFKEDFIDHTKAIDLGLHNIWFQWYDPGASHVWHIHGACHFTNVYYVHLPDTSLKTELRFGDKKIVSPIEEGQILTFPSFVSHRSPVNQTTDCKIIISFNTSINMKL